MQTEGRRRRIRQLVVQRIPHDVLQDIDVERIADTVHIPLTAENANDLAGYEEGWEVCSHTFTIRENGDGILSVLLEQRV